MAFLVKDTAPRGGARESYFVGFRHVKDPQGRDCQAADFGEKMMAHKFDERGRAEEFVRNLNHMAGRQQFVTEELSIYGTQYGKRHQRTNGFMGFGTIPSGEPHAAAPSRAGFNWDIANYDDDNDGYNGF